MSPEPRRGAAPAGLSQHILPTAGTMIGICTTLIGLVKVAEGRIGPSRVDEYAGLIAVLFLTSAIASYGSVRSGAHPGAATRLERVADFCFVTGLVGLSALSLFFAYELI